VAEWHLRSPRVLRVLSGKHANAPISKRAVRITIPSNLDLLRSRDSARALQNQSEVRENFVKWLGKGYVATAVMPSITGMDYILEPGRSI
jgi:hypothetical protein